MSAGFIAARQREHGDSAISASRLSANSQSRRIRPRPPDSGLATTSHVPPRKRRRKHYLHEAPTREQLMEQAFQRLPMIVKERPLRIGTVNKVFAVQWLSDDQVVLGTKCNKLLVYDVNKHAVNSVVTLKPTRSPRQPHRPRNHPQQPQPPDGPAPNGVPIHPAFVNNGNDASSAHGHCGIHAIDINPSRRLLATGGNRANDIGIYRLPSFEPVTVAEGAHGDWVFALEWLDDEFLVSGSRDSVIALWQIPERPREHIECGHARWGRTGLHVYPGTGPRARTQVANLDKVRAFSYNKNLKIITSVSLNSTVHILDLTTFQQVRLRCLNPNLYSECVCIAHSPDNAAVAIGCRSQLALLDSRSLDIVRSVNLPARGERDGQFYHIPCGVRSVSWHDSLITLGTGGGEILFYDVRAAAYLKCSTCQETQPLRVEHSWLFQNDIYDELFNHRQCPNAVYAHAYDESRTRLLAAGGPIAASVWGNFAAIWQ